MPDEMRETTLRSDRHLMPWLVKSVPHGPTKDCVLVATMDGNEMLSVSLHVAVSSLPAQQ